MSNVIIVTLLVLLVATNAYWYHFSGKILDDWSKSSDKWAELVDELIEDVRSATAEIEATTKRLQEGADT